MSEEPAPRPRRSRLRSLRERLSGGRILAGLGALVVAVFAAELGAQAMLDGGSARATVLELRRRGERAYPMLSAATLVERDAAGQAHSVIRLGDREVLPLGGIAKAATVAGDDDVAAPRFTSDEHGFENVHAPWTRAPLDLVIVGDERALGLGVAPEDNITAPFRVAFPATIDLGAPGLGPLGELGTLLEYGPLLRPRVTVMIYVEGDAARDLAREKGTLLVRYLEPGFTQSLAAQRDALDHAMVAYEDARLAAADTFGARARHVLTLPRLRELAGFGPREETAPSAQQDMAYLRQVFREAKRAAVSWGGKQLWLFYVPTWHRFSHPAEVPALDRDRTAVMTAARNEGLSVLDGVSALTVAGEPSSFFTAGRRRRFNERGYKVLGEALRGRIVVLGEEKVDIGVLPHVSAH